MWNRLLDRLLKIDDHPRGFGGFLPDADDFSKSSFLDYPESTC